MIDFAVKEREFEKHFKPRIGLVKAAEGDALEFELPEFIESEFDFRSFTYSKILDYSHELFDFEIVISLIVGFQAEDYQILINLNDESELCDVKFWDVVYDVWYNNEVSGSVLKDQHKDIKKGYWN